MGLKWVRLDTNWPHNPKFLMLAQDKKWRAICVYMGGLAYAGGHGTDGFIPYYALTQINGTKREVTELIAVALWHPCDGGWQIHDWREHQESNDETAARSQKARDAAMVRWHGSKEAPSNATSITPRIASRNAEQKRTEYLEQNGLS